MLKKCFKCGDEKPLVDFYKHKNMADGHLNKCKQCTKEDVHHRRHFSDAREKILEYDRFRGNRQDADHLRKYRQMYPVKYKAHTMVNNAIRDKKLFKEPCEVCNNMKTEAHHDDYAKPLNVRWLCSSHHKLWHVENGEGLNAK